MDSMFWLTKQIFGLVLTMAIIGLSLAFLGAIFGVLPR